MDDVTQLMTEHAQHGVAVAREVHEAVEQDDSPSREGHGVHRLCAGPTELEPIRHPGSGRGGRAGEPIRDPLASPDLEATWLEVVPVENGQHLFAHARLQARRNGERHPVRDRRQGHDVEDGEPGHHRGQPRQHCRPPALQPHGQGKAHSRALQLARKVAVRIGHLERRTGR